MSPFCRDCITATIPHTVPASLVQRFHFWLSWDQHWADWSLSPLAVLQWEPFP